MSRKNKLRMLIGLVIVGAIAAAGLTTCATKITSTSKAIPKTEQQWEAKYPQVFSNVGYAKLIESAPEINQYSKLPESLQELSGTITNKFGIRDDILDFIIKKSAESTDERIFRAAILYAQSRQKIYYGNVTQEEALKLVRHASLLGGCLRGYTNDFTVTDGINKRMRDDRWRDNHMREISHKYFSWQLLGSGLSTAEKKAICNKGAF